MREMLQTNTIPSPTWRLQGSQSSPRFMAPSIASRWHSLAPATCLQHGRPFSKVTV